MLNLKQLLNILLVFFGAAASTLHVPDIKLQLGQIVSSTAQHS